MAVITFEAFVGAGPTWTDIAANTLVFSSSLTDLTGVITAGSYQDGTHLGSGDPGTDQCGANHANNVKFINSSAMSLNGAASAALTDANLAASNTSIRVHFNHTTGITVTNARFYAFNDGVGVGTEAADLDFYAFERGVSASTWTLINDSSGSIGGDNAGERLALGDKLTPGTDHFWYLALSLSPEAGGANASTSIGVNLTYS